MLAAIDLIWLHGPRHWVWWVLVCGVLVAATHSTLRALLRAVRRSRVVCCPRCGIRRVVYRSARRLRCPGCLMPWWLGPGAAVRLELRPCDYCGQATGVTLDHDPFLCPNCGAARRSQGNEGVPAEACPRCGKKVAEGAIFCRACDQVLVTDFAQPAALGPALCYDSYWKLGKDPSGHYHYARVLIVRILTAPIESLTTAAGLLRRLREANASLLFALHDDGLYDRVVRSIPDLDLAYDHVMTLALKHVDRLGETPFGPSKSWVLAPWLTSQRRLQIDASEFPLLPLDEIESLAWMPERQELERRLGSAALAGSGGLGPWATQLITTTSRGGQTGVVDSAGLRSEVQRIRDWRATLAPAHLDEMRAQAAHLQVAQASREARLLPAAPAPAGASRRSLFEGYRREGLVQESIAWALARKLEPGEVFLVAQKVKREPARSLRQIGWMPAIGICFGLTQRRLLVAEMRWSGPARRVWSTALERVDMAYKEGKTLVIRVPRGGYRFFPTAAGGLRAEDALNAVLQWFLEHATTVAVTKPSAGRKLEEAVAAGEAAALGPNPGAARKLKPRPEAMDVADPDPRRVLVGDFRKRAFPAGRLVAAIGSWAACFAIAQAAGADVCSSWIVALIGFGIGWLLTIRIGS